MSSWTFSLKFNLDFKNSIVFLLVSLMKPFEPFQHARKSLRTTLWSQVFQRNKGLSTFLQTFPSLSPLSACSFTSFISLFPHIKTKQQYAMHNNMESEGDLPQTLITRNIDSYNIPLKLWHIWTKTLLDINSSHKRSICFINMKNQSGLLKHTFS